MSNLNKLKTHDGTLHGRKIDALVDELKRLQITPGKGYRVQSTPLGTTLNIRPGSSGGEVCPFEISTALGETEGTIKVTVSPGTVNELMPTNYAEEFTTTDTGLVYVTIRVETDGKKVTGCSLEVGTDDPTPQEPTPFALPSLVFITIGVLVDGKAFRVIPCGSIILIGHQLYKLDKDPPAEPGELPYTPFYVWQHTSN